MEKSSMKTSAIFLVVLMTIAVVSAQDTGMELILDDTALEAGDTFHLHYYLHNE